jgi:hypothetical protein
VYVCAWLRADGSIVAVTTGKLTAKMGGPSNSQVLELISRGTITVKPPDSLPDLRAELLKRYGNTQLPHVTIYSSDSKLSQLASPPQSYENTQDTNSQPHTYENTVTQHANSPQSPSNPQLGSHSMYIPDYRYYVGPPLVLTQPNESSLRSTLQHGHDI